MRSTAYHEAAHAVATLVLGLRLERVALVSAEPGKAAETVGEPGLKGSQIATQADREGAQKDIIGFLAGDIAEAKLRGETYKLDPYQEDVHTSDEQESLGRIGLLNPGDYAAQDALLDELHAERSDWSKRTGTRSRLLRKSCSRGRRLLVPRSGR